MGKKSHNKFKKPEEKDHRFTILQKKFTTVLFKEKT